MKKLIVPTLCALVGCAAGAALTPAVTAQWPDNPAAQRWQQECERVGTRDQERNLNDVLRRRGESGWELAVVFYDTTVCLKRPAP